MQRIFTRITLLQFNRFSGVTLLLSLLSLAGYSQPGLSRGSTVDSTFYVVRHFIITGNKVTKPYIIEREMMIQEGDTVSAAAINQLLESSKENILNTSLFNFVTLTYQPFADSLVGSDSSYYEITGRPVVRNFFPVTITIDVKERWYTWPAPVFDVAEQNINTWWRNGHNLKRATYGFSLTRYNFRGRKETVALLCRFGYAQQFGAQYSIPYINRKESIGLTFTGLYTRFHEVYYKTAYNQLIYFKDKDRFVRKEISGSVKSVWRKGIYDRHSLELKYTNLWVRDTVIYFTPDYFTHQEDNRLEYFTLSYQYVRDHRDAKYYPLTGYLADLEITRHGFGILPGENISVTFIAASARKWFSPLPRIYAGAMVRVRYMIESDPPYYHQRALGFSTYVRGFEYYVVDGQTYVVAKSALRYQLLKPHVFTVKWFPMEKFNTFHLAVYTGIFCDAGYVQDQTSTVYDHNTLGNTWLTGYGAGIDLVTYYDLVFRIEYTFNNLGERGFFLHMGAAF